MSWFCNGLAGMTTAARFYFEASIVLTECTVNIDRLLILYYGILAPDQVRLVAVYHIQVPEGEKP